MQLILLIHTQDITLKTAILILLVTRLECELDGAHTDIKTLKKKQASSVKVSPTASFL